MEVENPARVVYDGRAPGVGIRSDDRTRLEQRKGNIGNLRVGGIVDVIRVAILQPNEIEARAAIHRIPGPKSEERIVSSEAADGVAAASLIEPVVSRSARKGVGTIAARK